MRIRFSTLLLALIALTAIAVNFDQPFVSYAVAVAFLVLARVLRIYWVCAAASSAGFCLLHFYFALGANSLLDPISFYLGRGALLSLGWAAIWSDSENKKRLYEMWFLPTAIVLFVLATTLALNFTVWTKLPVFDSYLYMFDGSLGFQPSFTVSLLFSHIRAINGFELQVYRGLPLVIALVCAGYPKRNMSWRLLAILGTTSIFGYLFYLIFPATGPEEDPAPTLHRGKALP